MADMSPTSTDAKKNFPDRVLLREIRSLHMDKPIKVYYEQTGVPSKEDADTAGDVTGVYDYEHPDLPNIRIRKYKTNTTFVVLKDGNLVDKVNCGGGAADPAVLGYFSALLNAL